MKVRNKKKELLAAKRYYDKNKQRIRLLARHRRRSDVAGSIVIDSRKGDRRAGRENDLDREFVASLIAHPCEYCGDDVLRKTLDRIDNSIGHVRTNVVCACERCNYIRRAMPQQAWEHVAVAVREARELGLFGEWTGAIHRRLELEPKPVPVGVGPRPWQPSTEKPPHGTIARYHTCGPPRCQLCRDAMAAWKRGRRSSMARDSCFIRWPCWPSISGLVVK